MKKSSRSSGSSTDKVILASHKPAGSTSNVVVADLVNRRQNFNIVQRPPKQLGNQIFWCEMSTDNLINLSSTVITEFNTSISANSFTAFTNAAAFFDQYCIYAVTITVTSLLVEASFPAVQCYTALDYDSVASIGKQGIQGFTSMNYTSLSPGGTNSITRFLKPCIASQVTNTSNLPVPAGVQRAWLDVAYPSIQHYGFRSVYDVFTASVTSALHVTYSAVFGFRNNQ